MKCPRCDLDMLEVVRFGITLDNCPSCGGVWLDKGELGEIIRATESRGPSIDDELGPRGRDRREHYDKHHERERYDHDDHDDHHDKHRYKKKSFFDFFD